MWIIWIVVGIFVGWAIPQPAWVKSLQDMVITKVKSLFGR